MIIYLQNERGKKGNTKECGKGLELWVGELTRLSRNLLKRVIVQNNNEEDFLQSNTHIVSSPGKVTNLICSLGFGCEATDILCLSPFLR